MSKTPQQLIGTDLTKKQAREYMKNSSKCPRCKSTSIEGEGVDINTGTATQVCSCNECRLMWTDHYKLVDFVYQSDSEY